MTHRLLRRSFSTSTHLRRALGALCQDAVNPRTGVYSTGTVEPTDLRTRSDDAGAQIGLRRRGCAALSRTRVTQLVAQGGRTLINLSWSKSAYYT